MKKAILVLVVLAVAGILAYKFIGSDYQTNETKSSVANTVATAASSPATNAQTTEAQKIFYLFHNPKDQDEECREIYAYADRAERELAGRVVVKRPDVKTETALVEKYKVKVLPTILIASSDGAEQERFEGEGEKVSTGVENAIARLKETK